MKRIETLVTNSQIITLGKYQTCQRGKITHE